MSGERLPPISRRVGIVLFVFTVIALGAVVFWLPTPAEGNDFQIDGEAIESVETASQEITVELDGGSSVDRVDVLYQGMNGQHVHLTGDETEVSIFSPWGGEIEVHAVSGGEVVATASGEK